MTSTQESPPAAPPLCDAHVHLHEAAFDPDRDAVLERAAGAGVVRMVCNGTREQDWGAVTALARGRAEIAPCVGLHPWFAAERTAAWLETLRGALLHNPGSGVGEIGLDFGLEPRDEAVQEEVFRRQLQLARELGRPAVVHCVRAWRRALPVLLEEGPFPAGVLLHAFGGGLELLDPLLNAGAYFSFAGNTLRPRREAQQEVLRRVPLDRLLVETDSPDLPPPRTFGPFTRAQTRDLKTRNEPANLAAILGGIAALRGETPSALARETWENAARLFPLPPPPPPA